MRVDNGIKAIDQGFNVAICVCVLVYSFFQVLIPFLIRAKKFSNSK